jgi:hypothetical protein
MLNGRLLSACVTLIGLFPLPAFGAAYRTDNFRVEAPSAEIAKQVGQAAEKHRKEQAVAWLGEELPTWSEACCIQVTVGVSGGNGRTSFLFEGGKVVRQSIVLDGVLNRLLVSVLPHEITHTIFAHHIGRPVARWADEGGAGLAEGPPDHNRHDGLWQEIMTTPGRAIPLRRLLIARDYPSDSTAFYSQGYGLVKFLVSCKNRTEFLAFLTQGMQNDDWDTALKAHYGFRSVEELERAWLKPPPKNDRDLVMRPSK